MKKSDGTKAFFRAKRIFEASVLVLSVVHCNLLVKTKDDTLETVADNFLFILRR